MSEIVLIVGRLFLPYSILGSFEKKVGLAKGGFLAIDRPANVYSWKLVGLLLG